MTPTTETHERTLAEIDADLATARLDLVAAEAAEQRAFDRVSRSREDHQLGRLARTVLLGVNRELAAAQNRTEEIKALIRGLDRIGTQERERLANDRARAAAQRAQEVREQAAALAGRVGSFIADMRAGFEEIEADARELNAVSSGITLGQFRTPQSYGAIWPFVEANLARLATLYPAPDRASTYTTKGDESA